MTPRGRSVFSKELNCSVVGRSRSQWQLREQPYSTAFVSIPTAIWVPNKAASACCRNITVLPENFETGTFPTKQPIPGRCSTTPDSASSRRALRTVPRETRNRRSSCCSVGSRCPTGSMPAEISRARVCITSCLGEFPICFPAFLGFVFSLSIIMMNLYHSDNQTGKINTIFVLIN